MAIDRQVDFNDKAGTRFIYGSCGNVIQMRVFRPNAKIGDNVDIVNLTYDSCYNLTNMLYDDLIIEERQVNNLDILVPEQPKITGSIPASPNIDKMPIIIGTCGTGVSGEIVKDNDLIEIYDSNSMTLLGSGIITTNSFSVTVNLNSYNSGPVSLIAQAFNERRKRHSGSKLSIEFVYTII